MDEFPDATDENEPEVPTYETAGPYNYEMF